MKKRDRQRAKKMTEEIQWLRPSADYDFKAGFENQFAALERDMRGVQDNERAGEVFADHADLVLALMAQYVNSLSGNRPLRKVGLRVSNGQDRIFTTAIPVESIPL